MNIATIGAATGLAQTLGVGNSTITATLGAVTPSSTTLTVIAPVVVAVVSKVREGIPIPEWEQILSAGAVCQTMLIAAHAMGYVANWITEWCAYHPLVREELGLKSGERIAGFIYIGHPAVPLEERVRPDLELDALDDLEPALAAARW